MHPSHHAKTNPDKPAYIMASTGQVVTYGELDAQSNRGARLFRSLGLQAGDHIALFMENNPFFMQIIWAAQRAGLIYTAISTHLKQEEVAYIATNCKARVFISSSKLADVAQDMATITDTVEHYFMVGDAVGVFASWEQSIAAQADTPVDDEQAGIAMLYSSGTTGMPKGILPAWEPGRPIDEMTPLIQVMSLVFGFTDSSIYLSPAPLYHAAPLAYNCVVNTLGGTSIIMEKFDPEHALSLIEKYQANCSQWVPIMFIRMLKLAPEARQAHDTSSMKIAIHAAAPCPIEVKEQMIDWWGPVIYEYYSSTEGMGFTMLNSEQWLEHKGSVGVALNSTVHILDEQGADLPAGEIGTIYFESETGTFEYFGEPEKSRDCRSAQGWTTVGDVGYLDDEGYLYLTDRQNFMIISGGVNIYPQEIENLLITHEAVADVAVFGIPNEEFGEEVKAVVQPAQWHTAGDNLAADLMAWCKERLSGVKVPRSIDFEQQLPRLDNGKLYKRRLRDAYMAGER